MNMDEKKYILKARLIKGPDDSGPYNNAELTQWMCDLINPLLNKLKSKIITGDAVFALFGQVPRSGHGDNKHRKLYRANIRKSMIKDDLNFKNKSKGKELELHIIFFMTKDYERRDLDNLLKPLLDSLEGYWFDNDGQIKRILVEKYKVKDVKKGVDPLMYEQIYCTAKII